MAHQEEIYTLESVRHSLVAVCRTMLVGVEGSPPIWTDIDRIAVDYLLDEWLELSQEAQVERRRRPEADSGRADSATGDQGQTSR